MRHPITKYTGLYLDSHKTLYWGMQIESSGTNLKGCLYSVVAIDLAKANHQPFSIPFLAKLG